MRIYLIGDYGNFGDSLAEQFPGCGQASGSVGFIWLKDYDETTADTIKEIGIRPSDWFVFADPDVISSTDVMLVYQQLKDVINPKRVVVGAYVNGKIEGATFTATGYECFLHIMANS